MEKITQWLIKIFRAIILAGAVKIIMTIATDMNATTTDYTLYINIVAIIAFLLVISKQDIKETTKILTPQEPTPTPEIKTTPEVKIDELDIIQKNIRKR